MQWRSDTCQAIPCQSRRGGCEEWQLPEERAAARVTSVYWAWDELEKFYRKTLSRAEQWVSFLSSGEWVCACVSSIIYRISHRLKVLSASGSPYYINGKCSVEDNTQMVGCDERWHPARDQGGSKEWQRKRKVERGGDSLLRLSFVLSSGNKTVEVRKARNPAMPWWEEQGADKASHRVCAPKYP